MILHLNDHETFDESVVVVWMKSLLFDNILVDNDLILFFFDMYYSKLKESKKVSRFKFIKFIFYTLFDFDDGTTSADVLDTSAIQLSDDGTISFDVSHTCTMRLFDDEAPFKLINTC